MFLSEGSVSYTYLVPTDKCSFKSSDFITAFRKAENPSAAAARHPCTRKVHHHGLYSSGPNEEWCLDGHEKILRSMGISVWGAIDKCCRLELELWAVSNARLADVPPALYLRLVRKIGGMCIRCS